MSLQGNGGTVDAAKDGNRLIDSLPVTQRKGVLAQCERIEADFGAVLCDRGEPFEYAYFPIVGSISLVNTLPGHDSLETESIGCEGMLGAVLVLDINRAPQRGVAQTPCVVLRMDATTMQAALQRYPALFRVLQRYLYLLFSELSQTAGCIHFHEVERRLARGLLHAHDRDQADQLHLTHQRLAKMLGVQRGAVTIAACKLQREGIISYSRGKISILDRKRLEASSCRCYDASVANYAAILSRSSRASSESPLIPAMFDSVQNSLNQ